MAKKNKIICVLGMHRSGTSMLTRILNICGMEIGPNSDLYKNKGDNPKGHWENLKFIEINQEIINIFSKDKQWDSIPNFPPDWQNSAEIKHLEIKAKKLVSGFNQKYPIWGWKDPRTCLTLPFWKKIISQDINFVIILRNPFQIVGSLKKRNNKKESETLHMWSFYTNSVINNTINENRCFINFDNIFSNWPDEINKVIKLVSSKDFFIDESKTKQIDSFISPNLIHNSQSFNPTYQDLNNNNLLKKLSNDFGESVNKLYTEIKTTKSRLSNKRKKIKKIKNQLEQYEIKVKIDKKEIKKLNKNLIILQKENEHLTEDVMGLNTVINEVRSSKFFKLSQLTNHTKTTIKKFINIFIMSTNYDHKVKQISSRHKTKISNKIVNETVSIIIPTRNGGDLWKKNLNKIISQKNIPNKEIIVLDNNSTDDTAIYAKKKGCKVYKIKENQFGHGKTRAYGAKKAKGDYLIYTVQDATPTSLHTYSKLINFLKKYKLAAASGKQLPHLDADSYAKWQIYYHYKALQLQHNDFVANGKMIDPKSFSNLSPETKRRYLSIDDVIACYTKSVFKKYNFLTNIDFAEDLELAQKILLDKNKIGFTNQVTVRHSHNINELYAFKRSYIETIALSNIFSKKKSILAKLHKKNKIYTIILLAKNLFDNSNIDSLNDLIKIKTKRTENNPFNNLLDNLFPNWYQKNIHYNLKILDSIKLNIPIIWNTYQDFSKLNNIPKNQIYFHKFMLNMLGNYLGNIVYQSNSYKLDIQIRNLLNHRV